MDMTTVIVGMVSAMLLILAFILGEWHGRTLRTVRYDSPQAPTKEEMEERERMKQTQAAFRDMQNYNVAQAYGMNSEVGE